LLTDGRAGRALCERDQNEFFSLSAAQAKHRWNYFNQISYTDINDPLCANDGRSAVTTSILSGSMR
jgi:hypothetical protein